MSITIHQIQNLLGTYHRQQIQSKISEARVRRSGTDAAPPEDKVFISTEAKRLQIYQKTAEEVLKLFMGSKQEEVEGDEVVPEGG